MSALRPSKPPGYKEKLAKLQEEHTRVAEQAVENREKSLLLDLILADLGPLGELCQSTAENIDQSSPVPGYLRDIPGATTSHLGQRDRIRAQVYNLLQAAVMLSARSVKIKENSRELAQAQDLSLGEINADHASWSAVSTLEDHIRRINLGELDNSARSEGALMIGQPAGELQPSSSSHPPEQSTSGMK